MSNDEISEMMNRGKRLRWELSRAQRRTELSLARLTRRFNKLADSQALTEVSFNSMMIAVGQYESGLQKGRHPDHG